MNPTKRAYVSGALQGSTNLSAARHLYETLARGLQVRGHAAYVPHQSTDPVAASHHTPGYVFSKDLEALANSDAVIAFLGEPSLGVGAEVAIALERGIPVIGLVPRGRSTSRFLLGLLEASPHGCWAEYDDVSEAVEIVATLLGDSGA